jgi:hypothetical protein
MPERWSKGVTKRRPEQRNIYCFCMQQGTQSVVSGLQVAEEYKAVQS